jgi:glycosyltransferase involved in cell wall biosynthesis
MEPAPRSEIRRKWGVDSDAVCAGFVGRLSRQKAVDRLIEAFADIYADQERLHLVIVGDGPASSTMRDLAERLGVADRTIFTGAANGAAQMVGMDFYVMASRYEAFSYALLEAAGRALPIIATQVGGVSAVVNDGVNGYIIAQDRMDGFGQRMAQLSASAAQRSAMARESSKLAERYTVRRMVDETTEIYSLLQSSV